jgi:hypothetical protein
MIDSLLHSHDRNGIENHHVLCYFLVNLFESLLSVSPKDVIS